MIGVKGTSLGSLSEASSVFDVDLIAPLIKELAKKAISLEKDPKLKSLEQVLVAVDGTLLPALPKSALKHYGLMTSTRQLNFILNLIS
ncbi:MAG: hypothetical protein Q8K40_04435 [Ignavibacteria bacterium]|nr:hypothetical protein [Ignavibacteria bacterium]